MRIRSISGVRFLMDHGVPCFALIIIFPLLLSAQSSVRFAVIGDYGSTGQPELDVSNLVKSWYPDFIITLGDNNYEFGSSSTIDQNIGQFYHEFIAPYTGSYGQGDTVNRFFPSLGNHDWATPGAAPYLNYFTLPGNERYYDFIKGPVHFFSVDSDTNEPDGRTADSVQAQWLQNTLCSSTSKWKLVYFHHPPYSSGTRHGSTFAMQWPFQAWGATAVLSGHEHNYEGLVINNFPYFVNGLGGKSLYGFGTPIAGSQVRFSSDYGAMLVVADMDSIIFQFFTRKDSFIDRYVITKTSADVHEEEDRHPEELMLEQNFPNPFNPTTSMSFVNGQLSFVSLKVFDVLGREIATLVHEIKNRGKYLVSWDARDLPGGVYFARLTNGQSTIVRKMILTK